jgi:hypothetical protein
MTEGGGKQTLWPVGGAQYLARSGYVDTSLGQGREGEDWNLAILGHGCKRRAGAFDALTSDNEGTRGRKTHQHDYRCKGVDDCGLGPRRGGAVT